SASIFQSPSLLMCSQADQSSLRVVILAPFLSGTFDFLENLAAIYLTTSYPAGNPSVADIHAFFVRAKWLSLACIGLFLLLAAPYALLFARRRPGPAPPTPHAPPAAASTKTGPILTNKKKKAN